jgi:hypothetical protein
VCNLQAIHAMKTQPGFFEKDRLSTVRREPPPNLPG